MAGNDGASTLFAVAMRVARLAANGSTPAGASNLYVTDTVVRLDFTPEYEAGEEVTKKNGQGLVCLSIKQPDSYKRVVINKLEICAEDPELTEMLSGGSILVDEDDNTIGYAGPEVGADPTPNGVSVEIWTRRYVDGAPAALPFAHWVFPRLYLRPTARSLGPEAQENAFEGFGTQNVNWGNGPANDWTATSDRTHQWVAVATAPSGALGYQATPAQTP